MKPFDRRPRTRGVRFLLLVLGVVMSLPAGIGIAPTMAAELAPGGAISGTIVPGVHVGSVDLSGLDESGARQILEETFAWVGQGQLTVTAGSSVTTITFSSINRHVDIDALIAEAFSIGRSGDPLRRLFQTMHAMTSGLGLQPSVVLDEAALTERMNEISNASGKVFVNARAIRTKIGFDTAPSEVGSHYNGDAALPGLITQLHDLAGPLDLAVNLSLVDWLPLITDAEAVTARANAYAMSPPIVLANGGQAWTIPQAVVHSWISFKVVDGNAIQIALNDALIQKALMSLSKQINRDPVSASWAFAADGVKVVPGVDGREVDVVRTARRIQLFLEGRAAGTVSLDKKIGPTVNVTPPALSTADAEQQASKFKLLSTWTTYFQPAAHNGYGANIWVPAGYLDNQLVQPGETFSFWDRVGEVSLARGYKMGGAIVRGHTQEGVALAGGICSTSTTLFNAVARAGFKLGERSNHYYYIKRYPVGLDATVSKTSGGGEQDMTWTNDTPYPVLIKSFKTGGSVSFSLYGIPNGRTVTFSQPIIKNYRPATSEIVPVSTLPDGRLVRIEYPDDGFDAWVTRTVLDANGILIDQRTFYSHYSMVRGVQYRGDPNGKPLTVPSYAPGAQGG